jgi:formylglycine-generating enzyme required for sulfatase activity
MNKPLLLLAVVMLLGACASPTPEGTPAAPLTPTPQVPTPTPVPLAPTPASEEQLAESLHEPWAAEDWEQVIGLIEQILAINPDDADMIEKLYAAHVNYGLQFLAEGDPDAATAQFNRALEIKPDGVEAQAGLEQAIALRPTPTSAPATPPAELTVAEQLAESLHEPWAAEDWEQVIELLGLILAINPDDAAMTEKLYAAHINYGRQLVAEGNLEQAKIEFNRALEVKPDGGEALAELSVLPGETPTLPPVVMSVEDTPKPIEAATSTPVPPPPSAAGADMIAIPAGEFTMGSESKIERPPHTVFVDAFEMDQFEVTNEQFEKFVAETGHVTDAEKAGDTSWRYWAQGKSTHPVVKVSWNDAKAFCAWAGKRLPTEAEWEKAARGTDGRTYPWGNSWDVNKANTKEAGHRGTTTVGSFPDGGSPYGVMDMAGNVAEWTSDWFQPYPGYPGGDNEAQYFGEKYRVIRGGGWFSDQNLVRTTERSASSETAANDDIGFRCAR